MDDQLNLPRPAFLAPNPPAPAEPTGTGPVLNLPKNVNAIPASPANGHAWLGKIFFNQFNNLIRQAAPIPWASHQAPGTKEIS